MTSAKQLLVSLPPAGRGIYCNRTLNLRSIKAIGYDMDYTLIHYRVEQWELRAYEHIRQRLLAAGWPVENLAFDAQLAMRGLIIDVERGNIVKANRFGYVKKAFHGTQPLGFDDQRAVYSREQIDLAEPGYVFLNTLFSISEACMFMQLVDLLDQRRLPEVMGYRELYGTVRRSLDEAHMEGELKAEIIANPDRFVDLDQDSALALLDQREAGKKLLLITNSEWDYTREMMAYAYDRFMPKGQTWRDLFHLVIVSAAKPSFFSVRMPVYEVVEESSLLRPYFGGLKERGVYWGGNASMVEAHLGLSGDDILYVGDHMFTDVHVSKSALRWRTALILRELEAEIRAVEAFKTEQLLLNELMEEKGRLEYAASHVRLQLQRLVAGYGPPPLMTQDQLEEQAEELRTRLTGMDAQIGPLAKKSGEVLNARWGPLMRAGNDKSHLARQVERYADIYMSRVSNFIFHGPHVYLRSPRGTLPHDVTS